MSLNKISFYFLSTCTIKLRQQLASDCIPAVIVKAKFSFY